MLYTMAKTDFYKEGELCFNCIAAIKHGNINEYETDKLQENEFPIKIEDGKLILVAKGLK